MFYRADLGVIGLAVMGRNLALNAVDKGFRVAVYNRTTERESHLQGRNETQNIKRDWVS